MTDNTRFLDIVDYSDPKEVEQAIRSLSDRVKVLEDEEKSKYDNLKRLGWTVLGTVVGGVVLVIVVG